MPNTRRGLIMFSMQFRGPEQPGSTDFEINFLVDGKRYDLMCDNEGRLTLLEKVEKKEEGSTSVSWIKTTPTHEDVLRILPQEGQWTWDKLMLAKEYWLQGRNAAVRDLVASEIGVIITIRNCNSFSARSAAWGSYAKGLLLRLQQLAH